MSTVPVEGAEEGFKVVRGIDKRVLFERSTETVRLDLEDLKSLVTEARRF